MRPEAKPTALREVGAEPLPGYRLVEPLGRGGFGEVWKCEVPGGLLKAIKFVKGPGGPLDAKGNSAELEFQAIQRVKTIRHPFLLSLERVEVLAGELILVMELAECNLADRFAECRSAGQPGIARDELLGYLTEAAEALDVMNFQHGLQHLDVKPGNLFVVGRHIKVADFGLVNTLDDVGPDGTPRQMGGLTPLYVAPEMLRGTISPHSDQYSLAIVYQELLTGQHPYSTDNPRQVMLLHLTGEPDLSALPEGDRPAVAKALAKDPERRFPSCLDFVQAIVFGPEAAPVGHDNTRRSSPPSPPTWSPRPEISVLERPIEHETIVTKRPALPGAVPAVVKDTPPPDGPNALMALGSKRTEAKTDSKPADAAGIRLPNYQFLTFLGNGPLGELYTAQGPDGAGCLARVLPDFGRVAPVLDAKLLGRLTALHHPTLPRLDALRSLDGRIVLVTDSVSRTLQDRFQECVTEELKGIPRAELLDHLGNAAAALNVLRRRHQLWHLGLTPRAILLPDGGLQLGDFGLAQLLWLPRRETVAHFGKRYAAPELLQGSPNPTCDSYSLALIYAEMLTGVYPWPSRMRSRNGAGNGPIKPDLDWLPAADRPVIAKALDPNPRNRFLGSEELIDALTGSTPRERRIESPVRALPFVQPFVNMSGGSERVAGTPSVHRLVTQMVLAESAEVTLAITGRLAYLRRPDQTLEAKFPVRMLPGMIRLKLGTFCDKWEAKIVSQTDQCFVLRMYESDTFWQRCLGQQVGVEICLDLVPVADAKQHNSEAAVTIQPFGGVKHLAAQKLDEIGPLLLTSLRDDLQNTAEQRIQGRWPCSASVDVYPVQPDGSVKAALPGACNDVSYGGIGFDVRQQLPGKMVYLHFNEIPELEPIVLLARIMRVQPLEEGGFKIGAAFATTGEEVFARSSGK